MKSKEAIYSNYKDKLKKWLKPSFLFKKGYPLGGWEPATKAIPLLDQLTDQQLSELNRSLKFNCFTVDGTGRRFGAPAGPQKRAEPQQVPDYRVSILDSEIDLSDKTVLEVGCFEGVHTIALAQRAKFVIALDSRIENIVKAAVRVSFYEQHPKLVVYDLEKLKCPVPDWMRADILYHVGVLYHLSDPVGHLFLLGSQIRDSILLDTHVALSEQINATYEAEGARWGYLRFRESGYRSVFAGMSDHAKWLTEGDLIKILIMIGFKNIKLLEARQERNGRRILVLARRR